MLEDKINELDKLVEGENHANAKRKSLGRGLGALLGDDDLDLNDFPGEEKKSSD